MVLAFLDRESDPNDIAGGGGGFRAGRRVGGRRSCVPRPGRLLFGGHHLLGLDDVMFDQTAAETNIVGRRQHYK